eukprot:TRINITY_DN3123_c0_g1_i4.p2 TRINITY_DN3123_c0_g1~~TRINITY_DN3123_c0_g1_i4.p2  ORF type:complete len:256 (+),score=53.69 TRINITY_DN3123_c0_g1_i4:33-770(+)
MRQPGVPTRDVLRSRDTGPAAPLKKYHNMVKRRLLEHFATNAEALLDIACGRGGDLRKWQDCNIGFIKGVDVAPGEIQEAQVRYRELVAESNSSGKKIPRVDFAVNAHCGDRLIDWGRKFNVVSVMFALHYFFKTSEMLDKLLANVAAALQPNGFFVGTVPNGRRVMELIQTAGGKLFLGPKKLVRIEAMWRGQPAPFGSGYTFAIADTVTNDTPVSGFYSLGDGLAENWLELGIDRIVQGDVDR